MFPNRGSNILFKNLLSLLTHRPRNWAMTSWQSLVARIKVNS